MNNYDDIINLPHHVSVKHPRLSKEQRAAQFAPFAALTGYGDAIKKSGGEYVTIIGNLRRIDEYNKLLILEDKKKIPIEEIIEIL